MNTSLDSLLTQLRQLHIRIWIEGDHLGFQAPKNTLTVELKQQLKAQKNEILDYLRQVETQRQLLPLLVPVSRSLNLPFSFNQQRLWLLEQLDPHTALHNIPVAYRLEGALNSSALEQSIREIVRRHEVLRTTFGTEGGQLYQHIQDPQPVHLRRIDLHSLPLPEREAEAHRLALQDAHTPLDLARGEIFRIAFFLISSQEAILSVNLHHIAADGASLEVFFHELWTLYEAFSLGLVSPLPDLPIQYGDFAYWQHQCWQSNAFATHIEYWKKQLASPLTFLDLPTDHPRPPVQSFRGSCHRELLSQPFSEALKRTAQHYNVTLFMLLLAAFKTLLYRYTGQDDLIVGSPVSGRNTVETESLIGFFVNTLVLRTDLSGNPRFSEVLKRVKEVTTQAYAHQDVPFEKLVELLHPERDRSRNPLFQVMVALNPPWSEPNIPIPGLTVRSLFGYLHSGTSKFDLNLVMRDAGEGLRLSFEYNTDLFESNTIQRLMDHFQLLLEGIIRDPELKISQFPLLTAEEQKQQLQWNKTDVTLPQEQCIHHLVEAQARHTPNAIAVVCGEHHLTYQDLNQKANQLAQFLRSKGVGPERLVGICLERSLDLVVGLLGILKSGGAFVPLDPQCPLDRMTWMLADTQVPVLITQQSLRESFSTHTTQIICLDTEWAGIETQNDEDPQTEVTSDHLAYLLFTSGSTGKPKGVQIQHKNVVNLLGSIRKNPGLTAQDTLLSVTTIAFDIAVAEIFLPLIVGAKMVIASEAEARDGQRLAELISRTKTTFLQPTPATWRLLLAAGWPGKSDLKAISTGEGLPPDLAQQLLPKVGSLWNLYGPTETTIWSTAFHITSVDGPIPIGSPIDNTQVYILDPFLQPVPVGVHGELYIGGAGVARGYWNRPELTRERFVPDPFHPETHRCLYKTGDLAYFREDGSIQCLGRTDQQIKLRGFRIEMAEIEFALEEIPEIKEAAAVLQVDPTGDPQIAAYVVFQKNQDLSSRLLRDRLRQKLPNYMIPKVVTSLAVLPLTPNGKIDRRALPNPSWDQSSSEADLEPPTDLLELQLMEIWRQVLGIGSISIRDHFFEMGGHSLLALQLVDLIHKELKRKLPLSILFEAPTIEKMAVYLRQSDSASSWDSAVLIRQGNGNQSIFLVHDADGEIIMYHDLSRHLDPSLSVYGLLPYGKDGLTILHTHISDIIAHNIASILKIQPQGPYHLGGLCTGGILAFETARQLDEEGHEVGLVALFDAANHRAGYSKLAQRRYQRFRKGITEPLTELNQTPYPALVRIVTIAIRKTKNALLYDLKTGTRRFWNTLLVSLYSYFLDHQLPLPGFLRGIQTRDLLSFALRHYDPKPYSQKVVLFRANSGSGPDEGLMQRTADPLLGWGQRALGGVDVFDSSGGHSTMLKDPHVREVAQYINGYISGATSPMSEVTDHRAVAVKP